MTLREFRRRLRKISARGYVQSRRGSDTGIGYTLEGLLGIRENNIRFPDLGRIELKSKRRNTTSNVTLFTFNRGVWRISQFEAIRKYGYRDNKRRQALKCTVTIRSNPQGLRLSVSESALTLRHTGAQIAVWPSSTLMEYFLRKIPALILVIADARWIGRSEEFHYNEAYLLQNPTKRRVFNLLRRKRLVVDLRMHLNPNGQVRNRGTAFRISEQDLARCFGTRRRLL